MLRHFSTNLKHTAGCTPSTVVSYEQQLLEKDRCSGSHDHLSLLSYNIQVGIHSHAYRHYVTRGWQHILPHPGRVQNLDQIARLLSGYDIVALQEVDGGSIRTGHMNQVQYLAESAGFPYWYQQLNRNLGRLAQHSNGVLSRLTPRSIEDHKLPGILPGRGAIFLQFGAEDDPLVLVVLHLSLGQRARTNQLAYIRELISDYRHVVVMGDMNCHAEPVLKLSPLRDIGLRAAKGHYNTYPSWRPVYSYDHILVSPSLEIEQMEVMHQSVSDHLPIAMRIRLPGALPATH